jgi:hypothetical protein
VKNLFAAALAINLLPGCTFFERVQKCDVPMPTQEARARGWSAVLDNGNRQEIEATIYGEAYNKEVLPYLLSQTKVHN